MTLLVAPSNTYASGKEAGAILVLAGTGMTFGAFDYGSAQCPPGYTKRENDPMPTQCVQVTPSWIDTREATIGGVTLERRGLLWAGVAAAGTGIVLLMLPNRAAKAVKAIDVSVSVTPHGWTASKTIKWRRNERLRQ